MSLKSILVATLVFVGSSAVAQKPSASSSTPKTLSLNFEDELIRGQKKAPLTTPFSSQQSHRFKKLIKLREDFMPEAEALSESAF
ncbi:MAG: hypothetical protein HRT45_12210 [Bdellovibrionales bacterium]|nr:hypothetical protein [Bdellovibrionales bacterium]